MPKSAAEPNVISRTEGGTEPTEDGELKKQAVTNLHRHLMTKRGTDDSRHRRLVTVEQAASDRPGKFVPLAADKCYDLTTHGLV